MVVVVGRGGVVQGWVCVMGGWERETKRETKGKREKKYGRGERDRLVLDLF